jgi:hypothetical protein
MRYFLSCDQKENSMLELKVELFESLIGTSLACETINAEGDVRESWTVESVRRRDPHGARSGVPFDVYFSAPANSHRQQGLRRLHLRDGEAVEIFVVPVAASAMAVQFEAVFN